MTDNFTNATAKLFADDIKLYSTLSDIQTSTDFQNHLDIVTSWSSLWQIGISYAKCAILDLGPPAPKPTFHLSSIKLAKTICIKDLGILIDTTLKFTNHILDITKRTRQRSALIYRSFISRDLHNLLRAYTTYVRPLLEYASPVWSPVQLSLINTIENVQRSFTKRLPGLFHLPYSERLNITKLQSLEHRRLITDLTTCFSIIRGFSAISPTQFFTPSPNPTSRGHPYRLLHPLTKSNIRHNFFTCHIVKIWNTLPSPLVQATTPKSFKTQLSKHILTKFLIFPTTYT